MPRGSLNVEIKEEICDSSAEYVEASSIRASRNRASSASINESYAVSGDRKNKPWKLEEKIALFHAMSKHGCTDYKNLAEAIEIRDEREVKHFIEKNIDRVRRNVMSEVSEDMPGTRHLKYKTEEEKVDNLQQQPAIELWKSIISHNMYADCKTPDFAQAIVELFRGFAAETTEPPNANYPNFKTLYSFVADCLSGNFAGDLKSMDALVLKTTLDKIAKISDEWKAEGDFFREYDGPDRFMPESVVKLLEDGSPYDQEMLSQQKSRKLPDSGIPLDDDVYSKFYPHMKLRENINPMGINPSALIEEEAKIDALIRKRLQHL